MIKRTRFIRWIVGVVAGASLLQTQGCNPQALIQEIAIRQAANLINDAVFFFLDNALVRLTV